MLSLISIGDIVVGARVHMIMQRKFVNIVIPSHHCMSFRDTDVSEIESELLWTFALGEIN